MNRHSSDDILTRPAPALEPGTSPDRAPDATILFEPDGYVPDQPRLMGRQAAGNGFLRAAVTGRSGNTLCAYTPHIKSARIFTHMVQAIDQRAETRWIPAHRLDRLEDIGTLYLPDPNVSAQARLRLRQGIAAYSICGITHTTASHAVMDTLADLIYAPVMPWDALICTSHAVLTTVRTVMQAEWEAMRWRFGPISRPLLPKLPIIPLGVHCADFDISPQERNTARKALGIADDTIAALFVGRLSFHAKAHPHAMYRNLQAAAEQTGKSVALIQCGWFLNEAVEQVFKSSAKTYAPDVTAIFTNGKDDKARRQSWAAADIFISLSDNIQETFGLTPVEAMAAGLPVIVSDWDGYRETVRDGEDGFRIATWMPSAGIGENLARAYECGAINYDAYCGIACRAVSVDHRQLAARLVDLIGNPALRQRLGRAGQKRAREVFDWSVIYRRYRGLWAELAEVRQAASRDPAYRGLFERPPAAAPNRLDPFALFGHYATASIEAKTSITHKDGASFAAYEALIQDPLFAYAGDFLPPTNTVRAVMGALAERGAEPPMRLDDLAHLTTIDANILLHTVSVLAKMDFVILNP